MALFVKEKGLPQIREAKLQLFYSKHAKRRAVEYKIKHLPKFINVSDTNVFEVEITEEYTKYLVRIKYTSRKDLLLAIVIYSRYGVVKTCWLNYKDDHHINKDLEKYETVTLPPTVNDN